MSKTLGQQAKLPAKSGGSCGKMQREGTSVHTEKTGAGTDSTPCPEPRRQARRQPRVRPSLEPPAEDKRKGELEKPSSLGQAMKTSRMADCPLYPSNMAGGGMPTHPLHCFQDDGLGDDGIHST